MIREVQNANLKTLDLIGNQILKKLSKPSLVLYQNPNPYDDYEINPSDLWITNSEFLTMKTTFNFFSTDSIFSGILFSKSKKADMSEWFKAKFYSLYKDRLVLFSVKIFFFCFHSFKLQKKNLQQEKRVILLKGVRLRTLEEFFKKQNWDEYTVKNNFEKTGFVLSRKKNFEIFYTGPKEMHNTWLQHLRKCCILPKFHKKYKVLRQLGLGSNSMTYEAMSTENEEIYVVKEYDKNKIKNVLFIQEKKERSFVSTIENEINILSMLDNEHIMKLYEVYEDKHHIKLVLENLGGGNLFNRMFDRKFKDFTANDYKFIIKQILLALKYLHEKGIMHRDIKPENILFINKEDMTLKLGDFGLSEFDNKKIHLLTKCGTPGYLAPEILRNEAYDRKCDLFSVGVILYMM